MELSLWRVFAQVAAAVPNRAASLEAERVFTYAQLLDRSQRLAGVLSAHGLGHRRARAGLAPWESGQDLVAAKLLNGPEYLETLLGCFAARCAAFNVNFRYVPRELRYLLDDADPRAVIFHERFAPVVAEAVADVSNELLLLQVADGSGHPLVPGALDYEAALAAAEPADPGGQDPDDLYAVYTGGTTGHPKCTLWRQGDVWMAALGGALTPDLDAAGLAERARHQEGLRVVPNAPLMHGAAQWMAIAALLTGGSVAWNEVRDRFVPDDLWRTAARTRAQRTLLIGEAMARPAATALIAGDHDLSALETILVGGAATTADTKRRLIEALPQVTIIDVAGSTETGGGLSRASSERHLAETGLFRPGPGTAVLDPTLTRRLQPGEPALGWFATTGPIPLGYLNDPDKTRNTFVDVDGRRWSVPGDRAELREDGLIKLHGRDSATINTGGEKVFAEEVEQALMGHPQVDDVLVVGRPSERWGQEIVAIVRLLDDDVSDDDLRECAAANLARYKLPKAFVSVPEIVRSAAGKADYRWAAEVARSASDARPHN
jgi:acyl-CoA synthetase (AMP-forming)/AMP-acid ligase II